MLAVEPRITLFYMIRTFSLSLVTQLYGWKVPAYY